jgi:hypothetical protein
MVPLAGPHRYTSKTRRFAPNASAPLVLFLAVCIALAGSAGVAFAAGFGLDDDDAIIVGSDSVIYSLDLSTGVATAGATLSGDSPTASFSAAEANPTSDNAFITSSMDASLTEVATSDGTASFIEDDYGFTSGAALLGLARMDDGTAYMTYLPPTAAAFAIAEVDLTTGVLSNSQDTDLSGTNERVLALAGVADTLYGFVLGDADALYSIDVTTGALTLSRSASGVITTGEEIVAADTTADGAIYLLGYDSTAETSTLYSLNPASGGATTKIAGITGLASGETAENLAIATLLTAERPEETEEEEPEPEPTRQSDDDDEDVDEVVQPAPEPPVYVAPTKTLDEVVEEIEPEPVPEPVVEQVSEPEPEPEPVEPAVPDEGQPESSGGVDLFNVALFLASALAVLLALGLLILAARKKASS